MTTHSNPHEQSAAQPAKPLQGLLTTAQAADRLGLAAATLQNDRSDQRLGVPFVRLGGRAIRYRSEDIDTWIEARVVRPAVVAR